MTRTRQPDLGRPSRLSRGPIARGILFADPQGDAERIEPEGGREGAGLIRQAAVITRGEAEGHDHWIDAEFNASVAAAINAAGERGVKSRFTHPSLSGDGLGRYLGRWIGPATIDGDVVRADFHIAETARDTPDGDLGGYVLKLAAKDPDMFGASIAFERDLGAESRFHALNRDAAGDFRSPDPGNLKHFPHVRLARLRAVDVVDEPAANPDGMFHRSNLAHEAAALVDYALGLSDDPPEGATFEFDSDRIRQFVSRRLDAAGARIVFSEGQTMTHDVEHDRPTDDPATDTPAANATDTPAEETPAAAATDTPADETPAEPVAAGVEGGATDGVDRDELRRYMTAFGDADGARWFAEGKPFDEAAAEHARKLREENDQLRAQLAHVAEFGDRQGVTATGANDPAADDSPADEPGRKRAVNACGDRLGRYAASLKLADRN